MGLLGAGLGCVLFYPAAGARSYALFLLALFVLASGITLLQVMPPHWPIYAQSIRIVVELIIFLAVLNRMMPVQLSLEGRNFDVQIEAAS